MCPKDYVENRNISNILEEAPLCAINWNLWGNSVGARDFSPDWKHRYFGTEVPCPDNDKHQFIEQRGGFFQNDADITIALQNL